MVGKHNSRKRPLRLRNQRLNDEPPPTKTAIAPKKIAIITFVAAIAIALIGSCTAIMTREEKNAPLDTMSKYEWMKQLSEACDTYFQVTGDFSKENPNIMITTKGEENISSVKCIAANTRMPEDSLKAMLSIPTDSDPDSFYRQWQTIKWDIYEVQWKRTARASSPAKADATMMMNMQLLERPSSSLLIRKTVAQYSNDDESKSNKTAEAHTLEMSCWGTTSEGYPDAGQPISGVTTENYKEISWKAGKETSCKIADGAHTATFMSNMTDTEKSAVQVANSKESDWYTLEELYGDCASTVTTTLGIGLGMEDIINEQKAMLVLCPDHPKAGEIQNSINSAESFNDKKAQDPIVYSGIHKVPDEMSAGTWKTINDKLENCYWEMQDANGQTIDNNFVSAGIAQTITIPDGVAGFSSEGCGAWEKQ